MGVSLESLRIKHQDEVRHKRNVLGREYLYGQKGVCKRRQDNLENTILAWHSEGERKSTGYEKTEPTAKLQD